LTETVRVFGPPEELAERLEASGYDIPASEIEAGMELHLPCLVKVGKGTTDARPSKSSCPMLPNDRLPHPPSRIRGAKASLTRCMSPLDNQGKRYILPIDDQEERSIL
jgi:hypothetical protein